MGESEREQRKQRAQSLKKLTVRAGGVAQRLGGLAALTEDPVAIPSSQMAGLQHHLLTPQALGTYMLHMHGTKINIYFFKSSLEWTSKIIL